MPSFLKISLRGLWHNRFYSFINLIGLSIAIIVMLLAVLYWKDEHSYDSFHKNNPHLYRILTNMVNKDGVVETTGGTGQVQGPAFKASVPEVKSYVRIMGGDIYSDISANNKTLKLQPLFVENIFFSVFTFQLINGHEKNVLNDPASVVITESVARKFFNSTNVIGKTLSMDADPSYQRLNKPLVVSGVVKDPPSNSSLQFDLLLSFDFMRLSFEDANWLNAYLGTFVVLQPGANKDAVLEKFNQIYKTNAGKQVGNKDFDTYGYDPKITYGLQPVTDIHLNPFMPASGNAEGGIINGSNPIYAYVFMAIALFVLLMAAVNFININIAESLKRSKEIAIRKIAGSSKFQIVLLFFTEASVICFIAFLFAIISLQLILPLFNELTGKRMIFSEMFDIRLSVYFIVIFMFIIILAGVYPSFVLSNFKPKEVLYSKQKLSGRNFFGRGLVVFQFSLSIFLLMASTVYYSQMSYIRTKDLGYNPNNIIRTSFGGNRDYATTYNVLKNEFSKVPSVKSVSFGNDGWQEEVNANGHSFKAIYKNIDDHYLPLLQIPLKSGRNLSPLFATDKQDGVIVNEAFVKAAALEDPIGKRIIVNLEGGYNNSLKTIRGIVKDFHFGSLRDKISPMLMYMSDTPDGGIWIKFEKSRQKEVLAAVERIYKAVLPEAAFQYSFLDELNARQYFQELRWQKIITIATTLSFIVCCLGLFGLATYAAEQRIKEIGIRKVLGASVSSIVSMLSADFLKLVCIAAVIAFPVAWLAMNKWLSDFAYRIHISWWIFMVAGITAFLIALFTISFQAIKAAVANPVKSLRTE